jgi:hypothetical protein
VSGLEPVNCWVVCVEDVMGPFIRAEANTRLVELAQNPGGYSCRREHHIVESDTRPDPSYPPNPGQPLPPTN